jgi:diadenosine tetraphosphate (Ap4A) HIT family hydrolase
MRNLLQRNLSSFNHFPSMNRSSIHKGVTYSHDGHVASCLFCRIQKRLEPGIIEYEDDRYVAFRTLDPATEFHVLVTPKTHVKNLKYVKGLDGAKLLYNLKQVGFRTIVNHSQDQHVAMTAKFCFHVPPYNSIDHLHLHAVAQPETMSYLTSWKYPISDTFYCNSVDTVIESIYPAFSAEIGNKKPMGELFDDIGYVEQTKPAEKR